MKRWLLCILFLIIALPGMIAMAAASYSADLTVSNNGSTNYGFIPVGVASNNSLLAANNFILTSGLDSRVQASGSNLKWMLADNATYFATNVPALSSNTYQFVTGQTPASNFNIVLGYNGYITTADNTSLEPSNNFSHRMTVDLRNTTNLLTKGSDLVYDYNATTGNFTATLYSASTTNATRVNATNDDVTVRHSDDTLFNLNYLRAGSTGGADDMWGSAMRFNNIPIYQGSTITNAFITFTANDNLATANVNTRIEAEKSDNPTDFNGLTGAQVYARYTNHTTANITYDAIPAWVTDTTYNTGNMSSIITEIVNRYGWAYNNSIVIFWEDFENRSTDGEYRSAYSWDGSAAKAPLLTIVYQNKQKVTIVSVPVGETAIEVQENGTNLWATADTATTHYGSSNVTAIAVNDNTSPWVMLQNVAYANSVSMYKGGTQVLLYQPNSIILGTTMPDRATDGTNNDGVITFGTNPSGVATSLGSLLSTQIITANVTSSQYIGNFMPGNVTTPLSPTLVQANAAVVTNPLYYFVEPFATISNTPVVFFYWFGTIIIALAGFILSYRTKHLLISAIAFDVPFGFGIVVGYVPWWVMIVLFLWTVGAAIQETRM